MIGSIDSKLIYVCLINDYSLVTDLHIFVYVRAECASISLECTKMKLLLINNFGSTYIPDFFFWRLQKQNHFYQSHLSSYLPGYHQDISASPIQHSTTVIGSYLSKKEISFFNQVIFTRSKT